MILDAHGWPQWDVWILPFYLFAALAALKNRWFWCGCLLAAGAMLKGQLLFVAPFFVLWPLWQKRWASALRVLAGFTATAALISFTVASAHSRGLDRISRCCWCSVFWFVLRYKFPHQGAWIAGIVGCAAFVIGAFTGGSFTWLRSVFLYGSETLSISFHQLVLQSCITARRLLAGP